MHNITFLRTDIQLFYGITLLWLVIYVILFFNCNIKSFEVRYMFLDLRFRLIKLLINMEKDVVFVLVVIKNVKKFLILLYHKWRIWKSTGNTIWKYVISFIGRLNGNSIFKISSNWIRKNISIFGDIRIYIKEKFRRVVNPRTLY